MNVDPRDNTESTNKKREEEILIEFERYRFARYSGVQHEVQMLLGKCSIFREVVLLVKIEGWEKAQ